MSLRQGTDSRAKNLRTSALNAASPDGSRDAFAREPAVADSGIQLDIANVPPDHGVGKPYVRLTSMMRLYSSI
jgi:hypothetical protein